MADDIVRTVIEAVDNASATIEKVGSEYNQLGATQDALADKMNRGSAAFDTYASNMAGIGAPTLAFKSAIDEASGGVDQYASAMAGVGAPTQAFKDQLNGVKTGLDETKTKLKETEDSNKSFAESFTGLSTEAMAAITGVTAGLATLKKAWDFAQEGAKIERIQTQFAAAAADIGLNGEEMMKRMQAAVRGTVDDEDLALTATRAFSQGIITNGDTMVAVLELARAKAIQFGGDTQTAFQSIIQSTDMLSERGFKRMGINLPPLKTLVDDYAKAHGVAADSIDSETQKTILLNAALDKSRDTVNKFNAAGDDTLTKMQRIDTQLKEVGDTVKVAFANAAAPLINTVDTLLTGHQKLNDAFVAMRDKILATKNEYNDYRDSLLATAVAAGKISRAEADAYRSGQMITSGLGGQVDVTNKVSQATGLMTEAIWNAERGLYGVNGALDESNRAARRAKDGYDTAAAGVTDLKAAEDAAKASIALLDSEIAGAVGNEMTQYTNKQDDLKTKLAKVKDEIDKLTKSQGAHTSVDKNKVLTTDELIAAQTKLGAVTEDLTLKQRKKNETDAEFNARMAGLQVQYDDLTAKIGGASGAVTTYVDNSKKIDELKGTYDEINKEIAANAAAHDEATKKILFGIAEQQAALIQDPTLRAQAMNALAAQYGIIDQKTKAATDEIIAANQKLAADGNLKAYLKTLQDINHATEVGGHTAEQAQASAEKASSAMANAAKGTGAPHGVVSEEDLSGFAKIQETVGGRKGFDAFSQNTQQAATAHVKMTTVIKTDTQDILTAHHNMESDSSLPGYADAVGKMTSLAHDHYIRLEGDIGKAIELQKILNDLMGGGGAPSPSTTTTTTTTTDNPAHHAQHGADFIVPPGYPNDTYPLRAQSGERVIIQTPAQQNQSSGMSGLTQHNNVVINDPLSAAIWLTYIDGQRRIAMNGLM